MDSISPVHDSSVSRRLPRNVKLLGWAFGFHRGMDHLGAAIGPLLAAFGSGAVLVLVAAALLARL